MPQPAHLRAPAGEDLVRVGLVADVPDDAVARRVEHVVQRDRQLDRCRGSTTDGRRSARPRSARTSAARARAAAAASRSRRRSAGRTRRSSRAAWHQLLRVRDALCARSTIQSASSRETPRRRDRAARAPPALRRAAPRRAPWRAASPRQRDERRLALRDVLAGRLAERGGRAFDVEHVVDDLEREARGIRVAIERARLARARAFGRKRRRDAPRRGSARRSSSGASFRASRAAASIADAVEVDRLPARHPAHAGRLGEQRAGCAAIGMQVARRARRTRAPAARRRREAPSLRRTRRGTSACRGATCRRPCTEDRRGSASTRGSARPRLPRHRRHPDRRRSARRRHTRGAAASRFPPSSTA